MTAHATLRYTSVSQNRQTKYRPSFKRIRHGSRREAFRSSGFDVTMDAVNTTTPYFWEYWGRVGSLTNRHRPTHSTRMVLPREWFTHSTQRQEVRCRTEMSQYDSGPKLFERLATSTEDLPPQAYLETAHRTRHCLEPFHKSSTSHPHNELRRSLGAAQTSA